MNSLGCEEKKGLEMIRTRLAEADKTPHRIVNAADYKRAAVLVPLVCREGVWHILFTRRADGLPTHKGQVSFPGGAIEDQDISPVDTALRESYEEIGIKPEDVEVLGLLRDFPTITGYIITPVVGALPWPYPLKVETEEVERVFLVPLAWLADSENQEEVEVTFMTTWNEKVIYFAPFDGEKIWGATARITIDLLRIVESQ